MAQIVLVWNIHVDESPVTLPLGRLLKSGLEKRGHEVQLIKIPFSSSAQAQFLKNGNFNISPAIKELRAKYSDSMFIELHTTPSKFLLIHAMARKQESKIRKLRVSRVIGRQFWDIELHKQRAGGYYLEFPSEQTNSKGILQKEGKQLMDYQRYFLSQDDFKATKGKNFFAPLLIRRIVHLIDTEANTLKESFKLPRKPPHRCRQPYKKTPINRLHGKSARAKRKYLWRHGR